MGKLGHFQSRPLCHGWVQEEWLLSSQSWSSSWLGSRRVAPIHSILEQFMAGFKKSGSYPLNPGAVHGWVQEEWLLSTQSWSSSWLGSRRVAPIHSILEQFMAGFKKSGSYPLNPGAAHGWVQEEWLLSTQSWSSS